MGRIIAAISGKGGTGKTSFCANTAVALCALGERVLLIDLDAGLRNLDLVLGMSDKLIFSFADVIKGNATLKAASVQHPLVKNLRVLTAPGTPGDHPADGLEGFLNQCREIFSYTIIDCPAGLGEGVLQPAVIADCAVVVATPDSVSLRSAQCAAIALGGHADARLLINRLRRKLVRRGQTAGVDASMDAAGLPLLGAVPEDSGVMTCANRGEVLLLEAPGGASQAYLNVARRLRGERVRLFEGVKGFK